jgi:hypothetical protein
VWLVEIISLKFLKVVYIYGVECNIKKISLVVNILRNFWFLQSIVSYDIKYTSWNYQIWILILTRILILTLNLYKLFFWLKFYYIILSIVNFNLICSSQLFMTNNSFSSDPYIYIYYELYCMDWIRENRWVGKTTLFVVLLNYFLWINFSVNANSH